MENRPSKTGVVRRMAYRTTGAEFRHRDARGPDEPSEDVAGLGLEISSEKGLGLELTFGIADKEPADRDRRNPSAVTNRRAAGDLDEAIGSAVPETDSIAFPGDFADP